MSRLMCFLAGREDREWFTKFWDERGRREQAKVIALSLQARRLAEELGVPHDSCDGISWNLNKPALYDRARSMALWFESELFRDMEELEPLLDYRGYPLLFMHQAPLILVLYDLLQSWVLMGEIFYRDRPGELHIGRRELPLLGNWQILLTGERGLEMEAAAALAPLRGIAVHEYPWPVSAPGPEPVRPSFMRRLARAVKNALRRAVPRKPDASPKGAEVLVRTWGGYYVDQFLDALEHVAGQGVSVHLMTTGGPVEESARERMARNGIAHTVLSQWPVPDEEGLRRRITALGEAACGALDASPEADEFFSLHGECFYGILKPFVHRELVLNLPRTVVELERAQGYLDVLKPGLLLEHNALLPEGLAGVLPARARGLATLTMNHGAPGVVGTERHTFATEFNAVVGEPYRNMLVESMGADPRRLYPVGDMRIDALRGMKPDPDAKARQGFDPERPVCVFCDMSGWVQNVAWRHSTYSTVRAVASMAQAMPHVQFIYRVHGGTDHSDLREAVQASGADNLQFEEARERPFEALLEASDVVVSHNSSAIVEALASGVPVVYLYAKAFMEPSYRPSEALVFVGEHEGLVPTVHRLLDKGLDRTAVRRLAQEFFDHRICGLDGGARNRLADVVLQLVRAPRSEAGRGFDDWLERVRSSSRYVSEIYGSGKRPDGEWTGP